VPPPAPAPAPAPGLPPLSSPLEITGGQGTSYWPDGPRATTADVNGWSCLSPLQRVSHTHAHLSIFHNGQQLAVPQWVGMLPTCTYGLHTHGDGRTGTVHIEPANTSLVATLGTFFTIWGQPLSRADVGGITTQPVTIYVKDDGQALTEYTGDPAALELKSRREVTIVIGTPPAAIPTYNWTFN
jgi:hypothetical protein